MKITKFVENIQVLLQIALIFLLNEVSINFFKFLDPSYGVVVHLLRRDLRAFERVFCEGQRARYMSTLSPPCVKSDAARYKEYNI